MKIINCLYARGCPGHFLKLNFVLPGPRAGSVSYPFHVYTESSQKDTYWLEDQREQN